jgi:hypothetical protein
MTEHKYFPLIYTLYLHAVNDEPRPSVEFLMTNITFEMFSLLVLDQYFLILKLTGTVPT